MRHKTLHKILDFLSKTFFLPNVKKYIMLTLKNNIKLVICKQAACHRFLVLLYFISFITLLSNAYASPLKPTAEEYRTLGYAEQQKGNFNMALSYYGKAMRIDPNNPVFLNDMGVLYEQINLRAKAEQYYLQAIQADKSYLPAYTNLAYMYKYNGYMEKAAQYFRLRVELSDSSDAWAKKAREELLQIYPEYKEEMMALEIQQLNDELAVKAQKEFSKRIERAAEHQNQGERYFVNGEYKLALSEFNRALGLTPQNPQVIHSRNRVLYALAKTDVKDHYDEALKLLDQGDFHSAEGAIQSALDVISSGPRLVSEENKHIAPDWIGSSKDKFGQLIDSSIEHFQSAEQYMEKGNYQKAIGEYNKALTLTPKNPKIIEALREARLALARIKLKQHSQEALGMLEAGDTLSAQGEIEKILMTIAHEHEMSPVQPLDPLAHQKANQEFKERIERSNVLYKEGQRLLKDKKYASAVEKFDAALNLTSQDAKIIQARKTAMLEMTKMNVKKYSDQAIEMLNSGDSASAKDEIQKILATIPSE